MIMNLDRQLYLLDLISRGEAPRGLLLFRKIHALRNERGSSNVLGLTALSASQKTSDPRDHIYAKLSLADDAQARHIVPNYRKDAA